ncbi:hypothetical protein N7462_002805 [Penicillium macrosclerotiorum]|uniref:uncharacterized protein n=1 Tax=Penicillium macrosclerotiorum TaxID=303699 RepID=UPI0025483B0B|nr:uncharacterized protein N7462_002805 [Penicillium macrosclerotiorum]KAJ5693382.1 hypothetical protein N7462_002805 [Penicillium macrosclerotiorum]
MDGKPIRPSEDPGSSHAEGPAPDANQACTSSEPESDNESDGEASIKSTRSYSPLSFQYIEENGRRYCDDTYFMPNDETELTRLNIVHQIYLMVLDGRLTTAPVISKNPRILDIGTGPGDWAIEMSAEYPAATIIASDLGVFDSGLGHIALPNIDFQLADARTEWTYHEPFDLIHMRGLSGAFPDWHSIYQQAHAHLKPGGYIEVADADPAGDTVSFSASSATSYLNIYAAALRAAATEVGYPRDLHHLHPEVLTAAGFVDVCVLERMIPIGLWPEDLHEKTMGKMALIALLESLEAYALRPLTRSGKYSPAEAQELCDNVKAELMGAQGLRAHVRVVTARKAIPFAQKRQEVMARAMKKVQALITEDEGGDMTPGLPWDAKTEEKEGGGNAKE